MEKELKKQTRKIGKKFYEFSEELANLRDQVDMADLSAAEEQDLLTLSRVEALVQIAFDLYPYQIEG